ncbi:hypothetical protein ACLOJK_006827 [Asimina triloba]
MGRRVNCAKALAAKAMDVAEVLCRDLYTAQLEQERLKEEAADLLSNLAAAWAEQDEEVNGVKAIRVKALGLLAELVTSRSEAEALHARGSCTKLETIKGEVSLLRKQVSLLRLREAKLLSECEAARAETVQLWAELDASQAEMTRLQAALS